MAKALQIEKWQRGCLESGNHTWTRGVWTNLVAASKAVRAERIRFMPKGKRAPVDLGPQCDTVIGVLLGEIDGSGR